MDKSYIDVATYGSSYKDSSININSSKKVIGHIKLKFQARDFLMNR